MKTTCSFDASADEWRIRVGDVFDVEEAKACMQRFRGFAGRRLRRLVFDLTGTRDLHTAGLGTMLFIRSCCKVSDEDAHIVFQNPQVGMILRLANLDRWFTLLPQGGAQLDDKMPWHRERADIHVS